MTQHPAPGAPDYFALFQSMFTPPTTTAASPAASNMFAMLDPKELERKIAELETVLAWLKATTGVIEMSLQTMKYQQSLLESLTPSKEPSAPASAPPAMEEFARMAGTMNPAVWALNMMQQPAAPKATRDVSERTPGNSVKRTARKTPPKAKR